MLPSLDQLGESTTKCPTEENSYGFFLPAAATGRYQGTAVVEEMWSPDWMERSCPVLSEVNLHFIKSLKSTFDMDFHS